MTVWRITFTLLAASCFVSFGWAISQHFARPGSGRMATPMRLLSSLGTVVAIMQLFAITTAARFGWLSSLAAAVLYLASVALFWGTVSSTRAHRFSLAFSGEQPSHLLTAGPYRWIRHPFYTAYTLSWMAGVVATTRWWLVPFVLALLGFYLRAARHEEAAFAAGYLRTPYQHYYAATGMFLPRLKPSRGPHAGSPRGVVEPDAR